VNVVPLTPISSKDLSFYAAQPVPRRVEMARELAREVLDHYAHATTLVGLLLAELRTTKLEEPTALRLASVTDAWLNDTDHIAQQGRLGACLAALAEK
jgi:hypothetical protein